jgi:hypothetical protein
VILCVFPSPRLPHLNRCEAVSVHCYDCFLHGPPKPASRHNALFAEQGDLMREVQSQRLVLQGPVTIQQDNRVSAPCHCYCCFSVDVVRVVGELFVVARSCRAPEKVQNLLFTKALLKFRTALNIVLSGFVASLNCVYSVNDAA